MNPAQMGVLLRHIRTLAADRSSDFPLNSELLERFVASRDEEAFAGLIRRHGPMVWSVCRHVLHNWHDAEDVFQATFLVLARKAASVHQPESLASWLYGVAYHLAVKAHARSARQKVLENRRQDMASADPLLDMTWRELRTTLYEELSRLPEKNRTPLVLCYLQGKTQGEAARLLGWTKETVRGRLNRGREQLRKRLTRRGLALTSALFSTLLIHDQALAVPASLLKTTVKSAALMATGHIATGAISSKVAALASGGLRDLFVAKVKICTAFLLAVGLIGTGIGTITQYVLADRGEPAQASGERKPTEGQKRTRLALQPARVEGKPSPSSPLQQPDRQRKKQMTVTGRVLDPEGKPVVGAQVAVMANLNQGPDEMLGLTKSNADGQFLLRVRQTSSSTEWAVNVIAAAPGFGLGWQSLLADTERHEAVVRLHPEQVLRGRLIDLQGLGAAGVKVHLAYLAPKDARESQESAGLSQAHENWSPWPEPAATDQQGRFSLRGLGPDQLIGLHITDDRFARQTLHRIETGNKDKSKEITLVLKPAQILEGRVTYEDTGGPATHVRLVVKGQDRELNKPTFEHGQVTGQTDDQGRYRVSSFPGNTLVVAVTPPLGRPYFPVSKSMEWPKGGATKQKLDVALPRGQLLRGKVTEGDGRPVVGARIDYWPQIADNPDYRANLVHAGTGVVTGPDGKFQIVVLPGPGNLIVMTSPDFLDREVFYDHGSGRITDSPGDNPNIIPNGGRWRVNGLAALNLKRGVEPAEINISVRRGVTVRGRLIGPDGNPVAKARMICLLPVASVGYGQVVPVEARDGRFELRGCDPEKTYPVYFLDAHNQNGAVAKIPGKQIVGEPVTVRLAPCGSAQVRFLDRRGKPLANYYPNPFGIQLEVQPGFSAGPNAPRQKPADPYTVWLTNLDRKRYSAETIVTDAQGHLTMPALIPGATYQIRDNGQGSEFAAESGKTVVLSDISIP